jgi:hypothetical protein
VATGQQTGGSGATTEQAQQKAKEVAGQAKEQTQQAAGQARERMREQVDQRSTQAGEQIATQAGDIRTVAQQLREQGKDRPAQLGEQAAERAERLGSYLKESDADRILADVEDFARERPLAVIAGGIALGLVASRFLKASSAERYRQSVARRPAPLAPGGDGGADAPRAPGAGYATRTGAM